jgi:hypothetical protein
VAGGGITGGVIGGVTGGVTGGVKAAPVGVVAGVVGDGDGVGVGVVFGVTTGAALFGAEPEPEVELPPPPQPIIVAHSNSAPKDNFFMEYLSLINISTDPRGRSPLATADRHYRIGFIESRDYSGGVRFCPELTAGSYGPEY